MTAAHRQDDLRVCGATTIVTGQSSVFVNGKLWAVDGDQNSHVGGALNPAGTTVKINNKKVVVVGDPASADLLHPPPPTDASTGSGNVNCYG